MNMQIVNTWWTGKVFALSRCSDSGDKKTRNRRTKEERKTMVESFVKTYQELNNGKFPSLNLTHKEVGGSFYTVREIVREIIQDNRVLGPGNINSKVLNLEDCFEKQAEDSIPVDSAAHLSIATFSQPTYQRQEMISSSPTEHRRASEEIIETNKSCLQESAALLNELPIVQVMDGEQHHGINPTTDDNPVAFEEMGAEVEVKVEEDPEIYMVESRNFRENASISTPENMMNGDEPGFKSINMAKETNASVSGNYSPKIAETDSLLETNITFNSMTGGVSDRVQDSPCDTEDFSFASTTSEACNPDNTHEVEGSTKYLKVSKTCAAKVGVADTQFGKSFIENKTEPAKLHPVDKTPAESLSKPVAQDFHAVESTRSLIQPTLQEDGSESVTSSTGNASREQLHVSVKGRTRGVLEAARARGISNIIIASKSSCISYEESSKEPEESSKEPEAPQSNFIWDIFGSWLSAFVKFLTG